MKLTVFGATGAIGRLLVEQALAEGHHVTAYARTPHKLTLRHPELRVVVGQLDDDAAIHAAVDGADAVASLLGPTAERVKGTPVTDGMRRIVEAMDAHGVERIVAISTPSAPDPLDAPDWRYRLAVGLVRTVMHGAWREIVGTAEVLRASDLDWTLVRVGFLWNGPAVVPVAGLVGAPGLGLRVSRATVAAFVLGQLESTTWRRQAPLISDP